MVCSYIFVSEIMKMCKEKKVYENIEKVAFIIMAVAVLAMPVLVYRLRKVIFLLQSSPGYPRRHLRFP